MCRRGKDLFRSAKSSVGIRPPLEDTVLKMFPFQDTDVLYMKLFSKDLIALNSSEAIDDLLEKRATIYSDRVSRLFRHLTLPR